jgi:hypothetical protein
VEHRHGHSPDLQRPGLALRERVSFTWLLGVVIDGRCGHGPWAETLQPARRPPSSFTYCAHCVNVYSRGMSWNVLADHAPAERDAAGGIADWGIGIIGTQEFSDVVG